MTSEITDPIDQSFVCGKSSISRAELLWGFSALDSGQHEQIADILGFERYPEPSRNNDQPNTGIQPDPGKTDEDNASDLIIDPPPVTATSSSYYRITSRAIDQTQNHTGTDELSLPDWLTQASPTLLTETATRIPLCHQVKPLYTELADWPRVLPFLQKVLGDHVDGRGPDTARLVKQVAKGEMIRRIPRKQRHGWSPKARILIDINDDNFPYRRDFMHLRDRLLQLRGNEGLDVQYIYDEPGGAIARYDQQREIIEPWRLPEPGTPILILSDLAMQSQSRQSLYAWLAFGQMLKAQGWRATVLMPVAERNIDYRLLRYFDCVVWDRASRFKLVKGDYRPEKDRRNHAESIDQLLSYCFAGVRVDSGLLRAIRYLVPDGYDIGHETEIWRHQVVVHEGDEWGWLADSKSGYLTDAQCLIADLSFEQKQKLVELVGRYHAQYPDELYFEAMYNLKLLGLTLPDDVDDVDAATETFMQEMVATYRDNPDNSLLHGWVKRHLARHEAPTWRHRHDYWLPFLAFAKMRDARLKGEAETEWPENMTQSEIETVLRYINQTQIRQPYVLQQKGEKLVMTSGHTVSLTTPDDWESHSQSGALVLKLWLEDTRIFHIHDDGQGHQRIVSLDLEQAERKTFRFSAGGQHSFQIGRERFTIDVMAVQQQKQDWMQFIGSGSEGLYAESLNQQNEVYRWYWHPPEWDVLQGMLPGFWFYLPVSADTLKPDWATDAGRDHYGLYADAEIVGVIQRFRWIEPNSFMMGSPEDEVGRFNNETQHQVNLTQGYWLADTACTKELWEAVKHLNPNIFFEEKKQPIKNISWNEIKHFFDQIEEKHPELKLRLPTEAEWENACRAGTETAFHFGSDIALDQVNYLGTWDDYGSWGKGALQQIAAVKSYPPNAWGLYEMHGNVWEWCQDWYGEYPSEPVTDPQGPDTGGGRVLRGGSWRISGRYCRSAFRHRNDPSGRGGRHGFRLARGHELNPFRVLGRVQ
ncbi:MAG: formylglycine-generating enzyme family protein [Nitrosomonas sp.]|jgi:formylglycine-generating enzyme required for sulfatase activity|nr:formylglycine-generating enzyme family protein [Nitrosomonas sp.]